MGEQEKEDCENLKYCISQPDPRSLSPIVEQNENVIDCSELDERPQIEGDDYHLLDDSIIYHGSDSSETNLDFKRPSSLFIPETPPDILRTRIDDLKKHFEYITYEHEELREFTKLEKQVEHHNCLPETEVHSLKDELDMVNEKMKILIQENENFRNKMELKETQIEELNEKLVTTLERQKTFEPFLLQLGLSLKKNLQHGAQDVIENNASLKEFLLIKKEDEGVKEFDILKTINLSNYISVLDGIEQLTNCLINHNQDLENKLELSYSENRKLEKNYKMICQKGELGEKSLDFTKAEVIHLKNKLVTVDIQVKSLKDSLILSENSLNDMSRLLDVAESEKKYLKNELQNEFNKVRLVQKEFTFIINEFKLLLDSQHDIKFKSFCNSLKGNTKLHSSVIRILDSNNQNSLFEVLNKLQNIFTDYDDKVDALKLKIKELNHNMLQLDSEKIELKSKMDSLECQFSKDILNRIVKLENVVATTKNENLFLKEKLIALEKENGDLSSALTTSKHAIEQLLQSQMTTEYEKRVQEMKLSGFEKGVHNFCSSLLTKLENIDSLVFKEELITIIDSLEINQKIINNVDLFLSADTKQAISDVLSTLKIKIISYDNHMNLRTQHLDARSKLAQDEVNKLGNKIKFLEKIVKDDLTGRLLKLESTFLTFDSETDDIPHEREILTLVKDKNINDSDITPEYIELRSTVQTELKYILNKLYESLNLHDPFANFKELVSFIMKIESSNLSKLFDTDINSLFLSCCKKLNEIEYLFENDSGQRHETKQKECICETAKQLAELKESLVIEISSLDCNESTNDLLTYSSKDIFKRFMQSIINAEAKLTSKLQEDCEAKINKARDDLEKSIQKTKAQQSWIVELENELNQVNNKMDIQEKSKCEIESAMKSLSKKLENTCNVVTDLKTNISQLTSENNILRRKLGKCCYVMAIEKKTVNNLKSNLETLKEETKLKLEEMLHISSKLSALILDKQNSCNCTKGRFSQISEGFDKDQNCTDFTVIDQDVSIDRNSSNEVNSGLSSKGGKLEVIIKKLNEEKELLNASFSSKDSASLGDVLDKFFILKDVVEIFVNKIHEFEDEQLKTQMKYQNTIDSINKDVNDFKLCLLTLYKEFVAGDEDTKTETLNSMCYNSNDVLTLQKELESVEEECHEISKMSKHFQNVIKSGQSFINGLKEQLKAMVYETSRKEIIIEELYRTVAIEQHKNEEIKQKYARVNEQVNNYSRKNIQLEEEVKLLNLQLGNIDSALSSSSLTFPIHITDLKEKIKYLIDVCEENICIQSNIIEVNENVRFFSDQRNLMSLYISSIENTMHLMALKHSQLEDQINYFSLQLSEIKTVLSGVQFDMPDEIKGVKHQINYLIKLFKENSEIKSSVTTANQSICFFSDQFALMNAYINQLENTINVLQSQKEHSDYLYNILRNQSTNTKEHLDEANKILKYLISILPSNPSTPIQAINLVKQIIANYNSLKESQDKLIQKQKTDEVTLLKQVEEIKCLNKFNENLKLDQEKSENNIRNLRSELRNLRFQFQKRLVECSNVKPACITNTVVTEFGIQTDALCCSLREEEILALKESIKESNNKIQTLDRRIQTKFSPYKRRTSDLELALLQAKDRIRELNSELMKLETYNKDLIELHHSQKST